MVKAERYNIKHLAEIVHGQSFINNSDIFIEYLAADSRTLINPPHTLFFAIKAQNDGHQFVHDAYQKGVRSFIVTTAGLEKRYPEANWLQVADTLTALQQIAAYHRQQYLLKVVGITGSNGKTIVKEWLFQLLASEFNIVRSPKSYNSQIGVPLSVWQINGDHNLGIFEAGISTANEMERLANIIHPQIGILTNIREAHNEGFANSKEKLVEKLKLFKDADLLVYAPDDVPADVILPAKQHFTWSFKQPADLAVINVKNNSKGAVITAKYSNEEISCQVPFTDAAAIENTVICWATLLALGFEMDFIIPKISQLTGVGMRLQLLNGVDNCSLIDDSYSADISSLGIAIDFLNQQNQHPKRTLILSDLQETGKSQEALYQEIAHLLQQKKIDRLVGVGENIKAQAHLFELEKTFFDNTAQLLSAVVQLRFNDETILVKGARKFGFEQIIKRLAQKIHDTALEINLNALLSNLHFYKAKLAPNVKSMAMVKAFSYGSGSFEIANLLQHHKVDYLAVAFLDEGVALRKAGITLPIMVMSPEPAAFDAMLRFKLEPEIYSVEILTELIRFLPKTVSSFPIHLKLDTGMHRLGFEPGQILQLKQLLHQNQLLKVCSIFTHLVASDDAQHDEFTQYQVTLFQQMYQQLVATLGYQPIKHVLNTSGVTRWPNFQFDMVRIGIGLYGFDSVLQHNGLQTVAVLKTTISQLKAIAPNHTIGYGRKGVLPHGGTIATVKIGYADGYSRAFGNGVGKMLINGKPAPTIGAICMDMCMLDVTGLDVKVGDEVIVFNQDLSIASLAKSVNTIPYEILTNISQRVKRVYYYE